ncbi:lysylphosphatidylglycerol synthase-like protein [Chitinophaga skermanii]|uniref:Lysylphosphatidylglycerol synthase-like protein n=1 Tax=Chitinophaga skermanii TaxID=331697 RepID=A0A327QLF2_9BACT|nr:lysylphosphatidylglycerol synthase transmembrane domain-containing protein [Chitinophaga skermanii]RAJ04173.1 lysylphosphatidylglycerol synthase-like protein [Chitinophaga skermanii]
MFALLTYLIFLQLKHQQNLDETLTQMRELIAQNGLPVLLLMAVMMLMNWGLEAKKWQLLVKPLEYVSFRRAFMAILSGVSVSVSTPNRVGEYGGRILYLKNRHKLKAIAATIVGSYSQLIITIVMGLVGFIYYINNFEVIKAGQHFGPNFWEKILLGVLMVVCALIILLYFRLQIIVAIFDKIPILRKAKIFVLIIARYSPRNLGVLLMLSFIRYLVFSAQYLILLYALGVTVVWWQGFLMISTIYLIMAIVPTIAIAELGVRGKVSIYFLSLLSSNLAGIIAATVGIWLINLVLPAIIGSILLLGVKIFKDK